MYLDLRSDLTVLKNRKEIDFFLLKKESLNVASSEH